MRMSQVERDVLVAAKRWAVANDARDAAMADDREDVGSVYVEWCAAVDALRRAVDALK
jgi:hypothetical protein